MIHLISCLDIYSLKTKTQKHNKQVVVAQAMMPHVTLLFFFRKFPNKKAINVRKNKLREIYMNYSKMQ